MNLRPPSLPDSPAKTILSLTWTQLINPSRFSLSLVDEPFSAYIPFASLMNNLIPKKLSEVTILSVLSVIAKSFGAEFVWITVSELYGIPLSK